MGAAHNIGARRYPRVIHLNALKRIGLAIERELHGREGNIEPEAERFPGGLFEHPRERWVGVSLGRREKVAEVLRRDLADALDVDANWCRAVGGGGDRYAVAVRDRDGDGKVRPALAVEDHAPRSGASPGD